MAALLASLLLLAFAQPADTTAADTARAVGIARADTVLARPAVTVTATRNALRTAEAPVRTMVLGRRAIEQSGSSSVADLLQQRSGAFVRDYGSGGLASLSLRGASSQQTLVLLDGHRIADPQLGQLDFTLLPALLLESVEVMHGAGSALYGTDAIGGVVNLRSRSPAGAPMGAASVEYGAYGARSGSVLASGGGKGLSAMTLVEYRRAEGDFPFENEALVPAREVRRRNADRRRLTLFSTARYRRGRHDLRVAGWYTGAERGLPGSAAAPPTGERQEDGALRLWAGDRVRTSWGRLRLGGLFQRKRLRYQNPQRGTDDTGRTLSASLRAEAHAALGTRWRLSGGGSGGYEQARHPSLRDAARAWRTSAFASGTGRYGRLRLFPALRADAYFSSRGPARVALSPKLGANVEAASFGESALHLKASLGRAFRRPTFNDRFWQPGGNPRLKPERSWSGDAGLFLEQPTRRAELTFFARRTRQEIVWEPSGDGYYAPRNVRRVHALGVEASLRQAWRLADGVRLGSGLFYTFTDARNPDARDRSDPAAPTFGAPLRYVPRHQLKAHLDADAGRFGLDVSARYTGRRYANADGTRPLDPFVVVGAGLRFSHRIAGARARLSFRVENVLDADYALLQNRPLPPRHARLRLVIETGSE